MSSTIYWIDDANFPGKLAIMARPRAGDWLEDEVAAWQREGVGLVLSLLEREEVVELGLEFESRTCESAGIDFRSFPISDRGVPSSMTAFTAECELINARRAQGTSVAVHCRAGIGRSSLVAACSLVLSGRSATDSFAAIGMARGLAVPDTPAQVQWVENFSVNQKPR